MYQNSSIRQSFAAIVCTFIFGSMALIGAVGPAIGVATAAPPAIQSVA